MTSGFVELGWLVVWRRYNDLAYLQAIAYGSLPEWGSALFAKRFNTEDEANQIAEKLRRTFPFDDLRVEREEVNRDDI